MLPAVEKNRAVQRAIMFALAEDIGAGDVTTSALVPRTARARAVILSKGNYVVSGTTVARTCFGRVSSRIVCRTLINDGARVKRGQRVMQLEGPAGAILRAERTALNFMQRMTGIASLTAEYVHQISKGVTTILDTRKTTPGLRVIEKYSVLCGGGGNHRFGLFDRVLIKDNHRAFLKSRDTTLATAVRIARQRFPRLPVEIEVESLVELEDALQGNPDWVLLDNMSIELMRQCVKRCCGMARVEASGGVSLVNVKAVSRTGVDAISVGALTHSAPAADLSLEFLESREQRSRSRTITT